MRPPRPRPLTAAANERHARYVPRRLVSTTRSKSSTGCSSVGPGRLRPAAVTQMARPSFAAACSTRRSTSVAERTSPTHVSARLPRSRTSSATASSSSSDREKSVTSAPASARASAAARPIPRPAPVTIACRPSRRWVGSIGAGTGVMTRCPASAPPAPRTPGSSGRSARPPAPGRAPGTRAPS